MLLDTSKRLDLGGKIERVWLVSSLNTVGYSYQFSYDLLSTLGQ